MHFSAILQIVSSSSANIEKKETSLSLSIVAWSVQDALVDRLNIGMVRFFPRRRPFPGGPSVNDDRFRVSGYHVFRPGIYNRHVVYELFDILQVVHELGYVGGFLRLLYRFLFTGI